MPTIFAAILFLSIEIYRSVIYVKKSYLLINSNIINIPIGLVSAFTISLWSFQLISTELVTPSFYKAFKIMASFPNGTTILMNMPDQENTNELVIETKIHLYEFWNRDDMNVAYLNLDNLPKKNYVVVDTDQYPKMYTVAQLELLYGDSKQSIINTTRRLVIANPYVLASQWTKELTSSILYKKPVSLYKFYSFYYNNNNWRFYYNQI